MRFCYWDVNRRVWSGTWGMIAFPRLRFVSSVLQLTFTTSGAANPCQINRVCKVWKKQMKALGVMTIRLNTSFDLTYFFGDTLFQSIWHGFTGANKRNEVHKRCASFQKNVCKIDGSGDHDFPQYHKCAILFETTLDLPWISQVSGGWDLRAWNKKP